MRRVVSLFLPSWPTDRLRRRQRCGGAPPPETPLVLIGREGGRRLLYAVDAGARALGLHSGMTGTQAQALVPELRVHEAEPEADRAALERLALWAQRRYAPVVAVDPPDGLALDVTGATHLANGEAALLVDMVERLGAAGVAARAAMAGTYGAAYALARHGGRPTQVVGEGETAAAVAGLPVPALRLGPEIVAGLSRLGLERIGDLALRPRAPLARRFGPEIGRRLDQLQGRTPEPLTPVIPPDRPRASRAFAEPIAAPETLARWTRKLIETLCEALERRSFGARRLDLLFHRVDGRIEAIRIGTARPTRERDRLSRLLLDRLETVAPGFGIERMTLLAPVTEPLDWRPAPGLGEAPPPDLAPLVDALAARVGARGLYRLAPVESDIPERSARKVAPLAEPRRENWPLRWPRPVRLFPRPEPVETLALLPDHPPAWFVWRGRRRRVRRADGPERIHGEWIVSAAETWAVRDYFRVEDEEGSRYWLYREGDGADPATGSQRWFLHGLFG